jgi:hypothetical protein
VDLPPKPVDLVAHADEIFDRYSIYPGEGFRNHNRRLFEFVRLGLAAEGVEFDADLAYLIATVHDLGLISERDQGENYMARSLALLERETADLNLPGDHGLIAECLLYNHRVSAVPNLSRAAEIFRRAVWVEHSRGIKRYGLDRGTVRDVFRRFPRGNLDRVLLDFWWRTIRHEPRSIVDGILF